MTGSHQPISMLSFLDIYSRILIELSDIQHAQGYIIEAHTTNKHVLKVLQCLLLKYPNSKQLLEKTAEITFELCGPRLQIHNSPAEKFGICQGMY